jgi:NHL repeat
VHKYHVFMNRSIIFASTILCIALRLGGCTTNNTTVDPPSTATGTVSTLAGSTSGFADGTGTAAQFNIVYGIVTDSAGTLYVADSDNNRIRRITSAGVVTTIAGSDSGFANGTGSAARFKRPYGITLDLAGNIYTTDLLNHCIRRITPDGVVTVFAGVPRSAGYSDGKKEVALFNLPRGLAFDAAGNLYVVEGGNRIRKISPAGDVTTLAGSGTAGFTDGTGTAAQFNFPYGVAIDAGNNLYVADQNNHAIRRITPAGVVTTIAGNGTSGVADGTGSAARFNTPRSLAIARNGDLYVADALNNVVRKVTLAGVVSTYAGRTAAGSADGALTTTAQFNQPYSTTIDRAGAIYVADQLNYRIRKIVP